jgi:hypothetical protein
MFLKKYHTIMKIIILLYLIFIIFIILNKRKPIIKKIIEDFYSLSRFKKSVFILIYFITTTFSFVFRLSVLIFIIFYLTIILTKINNNYIINCPDYTSDEDLFQLFCDYIKIITLLKILSKNLFVKSKKKGFMRIYSIFNKNKKIDIDTLEKILFKYIFRMDIELAQDIIEILNSIDKMNKNKTLIIRILSKFKELMKKLTILSLEESTTHDFKIIIEKRKIKTNESKKDS